MWWLFLVRRKALDFHKIQLRQILNIHLWIATKQKTKHKIKPLFPATQKSLGKQPSLLPLLNQDGGKSLYTVDVIKALTNNI